MTREELENITWSFSTLSMYDECPYSLYLKKLEGRDGIKNFYAENGSACHSVFEKLLNKEISVEEAPEEYDRQFSSICSSENQSTMDSTYEKCMEYMCSIEPLDEERYDVLGSELKLNFNIGDYKFIGFADCVLRDKTTGEIVLVDHKSSNRIFGKNGKVLKNAIHRKEQYTRQLSLYSFGIKQQYHWDVNRFIIHHFKEGGICSNLNISEKDINESIDWALNTIRKIGEDEDFIAQKSYMMCNRLCDYREDCEFNAYEGDE